MVGVTRPLNLIYALRRLNKYPKIPNQKQIYNYLPTFREELYGSSVINYCELEKYCIEYANIPDDLDTPFVIQYMMITDVVDEKKTF